MVRIHPPQFVWSYRNAELLSGPTSFLVVGPFFVLAATRNVRRHVYRSIVCPFLRRDLRHESRTENGTGRFSLCRLVHMTPPHPAVRMGNRLGSTRGHSSGPS